MERSDYLNLSVAERLELIAALWNSLEKDSAAILTKSQEEELDRRIAGWESGAMPYADWETVKKRL